MTMPVYRKFFPNFEEDIIVYYGDVTRDGYDIITAVCNHERMSDSAYLVLATFGGDPHAGYRIARCLRHHYGDFKVLVPDHCKSAGTLITLGASELVVADRGELGPLDIQLSKPDEMLESSSGMDLPQALDFLRAQTKSTLSDLLWEIRVNRRLSTKVASELASKLTSSMYHPIYAQIDPIKLGEVSRANAIGFEYGKRLNTLSQNMKKNALVRLITGYPAHSFVIDRKECMDLFKSVRAPDQREMGLLEHLYNLNFRISNDPPIVYNLNRIEAEHEHESSATESVDNSTGTVPPADGDQTGASGGESPLGGAPAPARKPRKAAGS
ncbi:SDH family Clp fold serine proteinase [Pseudomonas nitroreducens]|nr:hypothetical protein [Pseudomonas nitroreducens]